MEEKMTQNKNNNGNIIITCADAITNLIQTFFIFCAHPFVILAQKVSNRTKDTMVVISTFLIMLQVYLRQTGVSLFLLGFLDVPNWILYSLFDIIACIIMAFFAFGSIQGSLKKVKCNPYMVLLWAGFCIFMLISAIFVSLDWAAYTAIFTIVFPALYFIWQNRRDYNTLFSLVIKGIVIFNVVFIVLSILFRPVGSQQYSGMFNNPNSLGQYVTLMMPIFLIHYENSLKKKNKKGVVTSLLGAGTTCAFLTFSCSRTAIVSVIGIVLVWAGIKLVWERKKEKIRRIAASILVLAVVCGVAVPLTWGVIRVGTRMTFSIIMQGQSVDLDSSMGDIFNKLNKRIDTTDKDLNKLSTHRTIIWEEYISRLSFFGHNRGEIYVVGYGFANTTHNAPLQAAYDNGIAAGVIYAVFNLLSLFLSFQYYRKNKETDYAKLPFILCVGYTLTSLLASIIHPFGYGLGFLFWIVQAPLFDRHCEEEKLV